MKPDVIVSQPDNTDFPLWREWLYKNREHFNQIIVCLCLTNGRLNITEFLIRELSANGITVIGPKPPRYGRGDDWRNLSVRASLDLSKADRVLFLEQDFIVHNPLFLETVLANSSPLIGFKEGDYVESNRLHPAFLLVDRELLNRSSLNFGVTEGLDHFGLVSRELEAISTPVYLKDLGFKQTEDYEHLAGLTQNYSLLVSNQVPNHSLPRFIKYNKECMEASVAQCAQFLPYIQKAALLQ